MTIDEVAELLAETLNRAGFHLTSEEDSDSDVFVITADSPEGDLSITVTLTAD